MRKNDFIDGQRVRRQGEPHLRGLERRPSQERGLVAAGFDQPQIIRPHLAAVNGPGRAVAPAVLQRSVRRDAPGGDLYVHIGIDIRLKGGHIEIRQLNGGIDDRADRVDRSFGRELSTLRHCERQGKIHRRCAVHIGEFDGNVFKFDNRCRLFSLWRGSCRDIGQR